MQWGAIKDERKTPAQRSNKGSAGFFSVASVCRHPCKASLARGHRVPAEDKLVLWVDMMWFCILQCQAVVFQSHITRCAAPADPCSSCLCSCTHFLCFLFGCRANEGCSPVWTRLRNNTSRWSACVCVWVSECIPDCPAPTVMLHSKALKSPAPPHPILMSCLKSHRSSWTCLHAVMHLAAVMWLAEQTEKQVYLRTLTRLPLDCLWCLFFFFILFGGFFCSLTWYTANEQNKYQFTCLHLCSYPTNVFSASLYSDPCVYRAGYAF